jgi:hypothetical protein
MVLAHPAVVVERPPLIRVNSPNSSSLAKAPQKIALDLSYTLSFKSVTHGHSFAHYGKSNGGRSDLSTKRKEERKKEGMSHTSLCREKANGRLSRVADGRADEIDAIDRGCHAIERRQFALNRRDAQCFRAGADKNRGAILPLGRKRKR